MSIIVTKYIFSLLFMSALLSVKAQTPIYLDPSAPINERIDDLLSRMTLEEKIGQMTQADHKAVSNLQDVKTYFLGSILSGGGSDPLAGNDPVSWADLYDSFQQKALETRLHIPIIYGIDAVHGHSNVTGAVIFPHNIGMGATRNANLMEQAARITAIEIAATGIDWTFAPCIAVPRDERWGRTYEGFGETPELAELIGSAAVRGFQNDSLNMPTSIVACAKHYIGDGGTMGGDDQGNTILSEIELRAIHLPGYIAAIENDVKTIMASYNSWNGIKLHGHEYLLNDVLKDELGFQGFVVSDWAAIDQLPGDYSSDIETSINAGIDMVMVPNNYVEFFNSLLTLVQQNNVSIDRINDAVSRILRVKFELGLFERPLTDRSLLSLVGSDDHRMVAKQCVRESQVILKKNDNVLPLPKNNLKVFVSGEHADNIGLQCGGWTIQWAGASGSITAGTTILEGFQQVAPNVEFEYNANGNFDSNDADYAIVVIGEEPYAEGAGDVDDLTIKKTQINLVRKIKQLGIPVITILISGRPIIIDPVLHNSDVLVSAWLPGTEGDGIAEILFGDFSPSGLLPMSWPKSMDQIPINIGDIDYDPLFEYGSGITNLSNSQFGSPPVFHSAMLTENGRHIELAFNKSMNNSGNTNAQFSVIKSNNQNVGVVNFELSTLSKNIIILELNEELTKDDILTISYLSGNISSEDGGILATFQDKPVINFRIYMSQVHSLPGRIEAEDYSDMFGIQTENTTDLGGGLNVGWIDNDDWLEYNCEIQNSGNFIVNFRTACLSNAGIIKFLVDEIELFSINVPVTNGWQNWTTISDQTEFESGEATIRIFAEEGGFNFNWFELAAITNYNEDVFTDLSFRLDQNYPNPFNPSTIIKYSIPERNKVELRVFDMLGKQVSVLVNEEKAGGSHSVIFDASNISSGVYLYRLSNGSKALTRKLLFLK